MAFFLGLIGIPLLYLVVLVGLLVKRSWKGIGLSVLLCVLSGGTALWAIFQSRSSTASIGIIGIPFIGALGGFLGLGFGRWRSSTEPTHSVGALVCLAGAVLLIAFNVREGMTTVGKNRSRDVMQAAHSEEIERDRALIAAALGENENRQRAWMDSSIRARITDRAFLIAALENDSVSPGLLDTLASSNDLGIALQAVNNGSTDRSTLRRIYETHPQAYYFFQALAANPNTPPEIIRDLYTKPRVITGLDGWFARNPATPRDVLDRIAGTSTSTWAISQLPQNPAFDCAMLEQAERNLRGRGSPSDSAAITLTQIEELRPTVCAKRPRV